MPGERYEVSWQPRRGADRIFRNIEAGSFLEASIKCAELRGIKKVVNNKEGGQMKACFHKATCKYFNEELDSGECACVVVCKFYVGMDFDELKKKKNKDTPAKEKHKKRHYARRAKKEAEEKNGEEKIKIARDENGASHITEAQIAKARKKIANAGQRGVLTDNQKLALETTCRVRFPDLSDGQKEQIIEIANSLPTK